MKMFLVLGLIVAVSGCRQDAGYSDDIVISSLTRQLAECAAVAKDRDDWSTEERVGRSQVNSRAAGRNLAKDNPVLGEGARTEIIAGLLASSPESNTPGYYESRCI